MANSIKLKNNNYIDSTGVTHNRVLLSTILNTLTEYVLYDNSTGSTGTITLNDSASNYKYIEIFYHSNDNQHSSVKVYNPNNKKISLLTCFVDTVNYFMIKGTQVQIVNNKINVLGYCEGNAYSESTLRTRTNNHYIFRVVGYKN